MFTGPYGYLIFLIDFYTPRLCDKTFDFATLAPVQDEPHG
jgi:hypothetical protein